MLRTHSLSGGLLLLLCFSQVNALLTKLVLLWVLNDVNHCNR